MKISQREYDQMNAKIEKQHNELQELRAEVSYFRKEQKREMKSAETLREKTEDIKVLEHMVNNLLNRKYPISV